MEIPGVYILSEKEAISSFTELKLNLITNMLLFCAIDLLSARRVLCVCVDGSARVTPVLAAVLIFFSAFLTWLSLDEWRM